MSRCRACLALAILALLSCLVWSSIAAQEKDADATAANELMIAERFLGILEKNPRRGTALDRVYGHHVERGTLPDLVKRYEERTRKNPSDGIAWLVLGLLEAQRGKDAAAVAALRQAEKVRADDPLASYYLGQSLVLVGQPDAAAEAFERCINRKPARADLLEAFQALGRVYQRSQRSEQALEVWSRLEKLFPDDARVQEQIAGTLAEEGQHEQGLARYEALWKKARDNYRQTLFRMEAAELKVKLGRTQQALTDLEAILAGLNPESWLYRDVRRRIEEVFLRNDDQNGLAKYYESWVTKNPEDVEAMARLARALANQGRSPEAQTVIEKAIKLAPTRKELRLTLIEQFVFEQKFPQAIAQYEALAKNDPSNPDYIREWGKHILKDTSKPLSERRKEAGAVWNKLIDAKPKDPLTATQVADLFRHGEMSEEALALYKKAIELAPTAAQYHEYLGEYYHSLKRSKEALDTWKFIARGENRTAKNLARLAEVLSGFGYTKEAIEAIADACKLEGDNFNQQIKYAELLHSAERWPDSLKQLEIAAKLISNEEEAELVLQGQIKNYQSAELLEEEIEKLDKDLKSNKDATAKRWHRLARYHEANRQLGEATAALAKVIALDQKWIPGWASAARIHEASGNLLAAAEANRRLAAIDRRFRSEYLTNVAKLESRLGRKEQALQAGRELLAAAPGNPDTFKFYAELCFQLDEEKEGLEALRRSVRVNPSEPQVLLGLAQALGERFRTDEAIELYWRAFEKAADMEAKLGVVSKLAEMYLQINHFERLLERLERERRENDKTREMTLCLAQAYHAAGDFGTARQQLERLLTENTRDSQLLQQLSTLSESEGDLAAATKYQRQLVKSAPTKEAEGKLAMLLVKTGETDEARAIWVKQAASEQEVHRILQIVDSMLNNGQRETALQLTERLLRDHPNHWEALYREGVALLGMDKAEEGLKRFKAVLDQRIADDSVNAATKAKQKEKPGRLANTSARTQQMMGGNQQSFPLQDRTTNIWYVRMAVGLDQRESYYAQQGLWTPHDFGSARMAALGWMLAHAQKQNKQEAFVAEQKKLRDKAPNDARLAWDWFYLQALRQDQGETYQAAKALVKSTDPAAHWMYLNWLGSRTIGKGNRVVRRTGANETDNTPPLPVEEQEHVLASYRTLRKQRPEWLTQQLLNNVIVELKRAKRTKDEDEVYQQSVQAAEQANAITQVMQLAASRGDMDGLVKLFDKLERTQGNRLGSNPIAPFQASANALAQAMFVRAKAKALADVPKLLDRYLAALRKHKKANPPTKSSASRTSYPGQNYYYIWTGTQQRYAQFDYPTPNEYYDSGAINLLRQAWELYRREDLVSDLVTSLRGQLDKLPGEERVWVYLGLCYVNWWNDDKEIAVAELGKASDVVPTDTNLRFEVATIRERNNDPEEALAVIETIVPLDQPTMQKKENAALRLAVRTGNIDRARQAADRLFGLRLDAETQVTLAGQMRQLGMHENAEAVLARARRQAGNRTAALVSLLMQYQQQNKLDTAVQVAHQLLRRGPSLNFGGGRGNQQGNEGRDQAIQVLARSGKLKELIERAETQLKNAPRSIQIHLTLADYYRAAGQRDKVTDVYERMAKLKPDDAKMRYQVAQNLVAAGEIKSALDHYLAALRKEPSLYANNYWEIQNYFRQAGRGEELAQFFEDMDLKAFGGSYWTVMEFVRALLEDEKNQARGLRLFKKAWTSYPEQRSELISSLYRDELWRLPEIYDYVKQAVIPAEGGSTIDAWSAVDHIYSWSGDGKVTGVVNRLITGATRQNKIDALTKEIEAALKKYPDWSGGKAILALLTVRAGKIAEAKKMIQEILDDKKNPIPMQARWVIGQELEDYADLQPQTLALYEGSLKDAGDDRNMEYSYSPIKRLVGLYDKAGRSEEARTMVLRFAKMDTGYDYDPGYSAYRKINELNSIGEQLLDLGYPIDAVGIFNDVLSDSSRLGAASRYGSDHYKQQAQQGLSRALQDLKPETLARAMRQLLTPRGDPKVSGSAIDLLVLVQNRDLSRASLSSMTASTLKSALDRTELQAEVQTRLADLSTSRPGDLSVALASTLAALSKAKTNPEAALEALDRLVKLADDNPLEKLPEGTRANARQRADAAPQMALWIVSRECQKHDSLRPAGDKLGARAIEAARRQTDQVFVLAILREWGQMALDRGDRATAEQRWAQMLEMVLTNPKAQKATADTSAALAPAPVVVPVGGGPEEESEDVKRQAAVKPKSAPVPVVTMEQFNRATDIARLAAENEMKALSLRAVREALRGGPPIAVMNEGLSRVRFAGQRNLDDDESLQQQVETKLQAVEALWKRRKFPASDVYATFRDIVLPPARPGEIFLYAQPLHSNVQQPRSVAGSLARWAAEANTSDDLRQRTVARGKMPLAELQAQIILGLVGLTAKDDQLTKQQLELLAARVQKDSLQNTAELVCHVAMPALSTGSLASAALPVVERAAKNMSAQSSDEPAGSVILALARFHYGKGNHAEGKKQVEDYLRVVDQMNVRYSGDYGLYRRKQQLQTAALVMARGFQLKDAMELMGQAVDIPRYRYGGDASMGSLAGMVGRQLAEKPPGERYELLKDWTLPAANRKAVRFVGAFAPEDQPPAIFGKFSRPESHGSPGVVSSSTLLVEAAHAIGKIDDLTAAVQAAVDQKAENAEALNTLVQMARGQGDKVKPQLQKLLAELPLKRQPGKDRSDSGNKPLEWSDYLIARACLADPKLAELGERMAEQLIQQTQAAQMHEHLVHLRRDLAVSRVTRTGGKLHHDPGLALWNPSTSTGPLVHSAGVVPAWWSAYDGHIVHVAGPEKDYLHFAYPLTGTFEFSVDCYVGGWAESVAGYGGLTFEPFWGGRGQATVWPAGEGEQITKPYRFMKNDTYNRITIQVEPGKVRHIANGRLIWENTDPSPTSPWLSLFTRRERHTVWKNLKITGTPQVPREVALVNGEHMTGWIANFYSETQPPKLKQPEKPKGEDETAGTTRRTAGTPPPPKNPDEFDWHARDGMLIGKRHEGLSPPEPIQSRLYYHRSLQDGEAVRYEFFYEPDNFQVHPALDRLAFVLEPDGVRLHWMTDVDNEWTGLKSDNIAVDPGSRRGPEKLPLKLGAWNAMKVSLAGQTAILELNGMEIYRRELEPTNDRLFGFFRWKDRSAVQIRNVALTGNWPEVLNPAQLANLAALKQPSDAAESRSRVALLTEPFFYHDVPDVLREARALPLPERYPFLAKWVMPTEQHETYRLYGQFSPPEMPGGAGARQGGQIEAPAIELVRTAKALGKLDELAARVEKSTTFRDELDQRSKLALEALIRMAQGRDADAVACFKKLQPIVMKLGPDEPGRIRWPEVVAASQAVDRPQARVGALALLDKMEVDQLRQIPWEKQQIAGVDWLQQVRNLRARMQVLNLPPEQQAPFGSDPKLAHWSSVTQTRASTNGRGFPLPHWTNQKGALIHYPGHSDDYAYFNVPLRGDFELECELTSFGYRESQLHYGGREFKLGWDLKYYEVNHFGRNLFKGIVQPPVASVKDWYAYRLVVQNGKLTSFVNGRKLHDETVPVTGDPWLALHVHNYLTGGMRNLKFTGKPTIPDSIDWAKATDLTGWLADYYDETVTGQNPAWERRGEEIYGRGVPGAEGSKQESLLRYHRPMLEDGTVEYEFYSVPGKVLTHPAFDRLAFLLEPDGVKFHWLTDGVHDRTGLSPDNATVEKESRRGPDRLPLKDREWNKLKLGLKGDTVSLWLNDVLICERPLEKNNLRFFGFFHYADETEVRVRNVVYRGAWAKTLPPVDAMLSSRAKQP